MVQTERYLHPLKPQTTSGWSPDHALNSVSFRIHLEDANEGDLLVDFGYIMMKNPRGKGLVSVPAWKVLFQLAGKGAKAPSWDSIGKQWGGWRFNKDQTCIILCIDTGTGQSPMDVFVLQGAGNPVLPPNSGGARYLSPPAKDALADPINWEALDPAGNPDDQLMDIQKNRGGR